MDVTVASDDVAEDDTETTDHIAHHSMLSRMALNDNKAGMNGLDKEKINRYCQIPFVVIHVMHMNFGVLRCNLNLKIMAFRHEHELKNILDGQDSITKSTQQINYLQ